MSKTKQKPTRTTKNNSDTEWKKRFQIEKPTLHARKKRTSEWKSGEKSASLKLNEWSFILQHVCLRVRVRVYFEVGISYMEKEGAEANARVCVDFLILS